MNGSGQKIPINSRLMAALEIEQRFCDRSAPWAGWQSAGGQRPLFLIHQPMMVKRITQATGR